MSNIRILLFTVLLILQSSCGFRPAYKVENNRNHHILSTIEIDHISSIEGTYFYNHLKTILPPPTEPKYILNTKLSFAGSYNIIQQNSDILRETQKMSVNYQLTDKKSQKIVTKGNFTKLNSYNVNFSLYSNAVLREEAMTLLASNAAEEIRNRLIMFFANLPSFN